MIQIDVSTETQAKEQALRYSQENPDKYIIISACFGLFVEIHNYLNVYAPNDSYFNWYVLNGKIRPFTQKQIIADQIASLNNSNH